MPKNSKHNNQFGSYQQNPYETTIIPYRYGGKDENHITPIGIDQFPNIMIYRYFILNFLSNDNNYKDDVPKYNSALQEFLDIEIKTNTKKSEEIEKNEQQNNSYEINGSNIEEEDITEEIEINKQKHTINIPKEYKNIKYDHYINYMLENNLFNINNYAHHLDFVNVLLVNNLLHKQDSDQCNSCILSNMGKNKNKPIEEDNNEKIIDFSEYIYNNWRKTEDNEAINMLYKRGGSLVFNKKFKFEYKFVTNDKIETYSLSELPHIMGSDLDIELKIIKTIEKKAKKDDEENLEPKYIISIYDLIKIQGDKFNPSILKEYYAEDGLFYRNTFKPTQYMKLNADENKEFPTIKLLILNLVNHKIDRYNWIINWLANFFQTLVKSQCALVLIGEQGSGKGIFYNEIIKKLFGEDYCIQTGNAALKTNYKGALLKDKLFINFNEIATRNNTDIKNFLKALITDKSAIEEEKQITMRESVELFGQILITSNDNFPIDIEEHDRRYSVFSTAMNIQKSNYFGYGNYENLIVHIEDELEDFAKFLKSYDVNKELVNTPLNTVEKQAIINLSKDTFKLFFQAIISMNEDYFSYLKEVNEKLHIVIIEDFKERKIIRRRNIPLAYNEIYRTKLSSKTIMDRLRVYDINGIISTDKGLGDGKTLYYKLH